MNFPFLTSLVQRQNIWKKLCSCFSKQVFLKISQYSQENTFVGVSLNKAANYQGCNFIKTRLQHWCFPVNIAKTFQNSFLYGAPPLTASEFAKSLFTWFRIHKPCPKTGVTLQILSHEARNKVLVKYLTSQYTYWFEDCEFI